MKNFQSLIDRYGADLSRWPAPLAEEAKRFLVVSDEARLALESFAALESLIVESRPEAAEARVRRVINRSMLSIQQSYRPLSLGERLRVLLAAPIPRVAFVTGLTLGGFVLGIALRAPETHAPDAAGSPLLTASADDVAF